MKAKHPSLVHDGRTSRQSSLNTSTAPLFCLGTHGRTPSSPCHNWCCDGLYCILTVEWTAWDEQWNSSNAFCVVIYWLQSPQQNPGSIPQVSFYVDFICVSALSKIVLTSHPCHLNSEEKWLDGTVENSNSETSPDLKTASFIVAKHWAASALRGYSICCCLCVNTQHQKCRNYDKWSKYMVNT